MARKPEIAELPTRLLMQTLGSERRYKRIVVFGGIAAVVIGGGVFVAFRTIDAQNVAARDAAFGGLQSCLLGTEPLHSGETPSARVTDIKRGVVGVPLEKRAKAGELAWPASCSTQAYALAEHATGTPVGAAAEALAKALRADASAIGDEHAEIDKLWAEAQAAKITGTVPADAPQAPKPLLPLYTADQFRALPKFLSGTFSLANVWPDPAPGGKLFFVIDQKDTAEGPVLCTATATDTAVKCLKLPASVAALSPGVRLIGTTDDAARPFFFTGDRGQLGIFPPDGKAAVAQATAFGAAAHADGSIAILARKESGKELHLIVQPATGVASDQVALPPTDFDVPTQTGFFWDWLVWRNPGPTKGGAAHLSARKLEGTILKPAIDVGEIDEPPPPDKAERDREQIAACKSDDGIAVRLRGMKGDVVSFFAGGRWSAPVKSQTRGGAFTCHGLEAISTVVEHVADRDKDSPTITQSRCNTSGCTTTRVEVRQLLAGLDIGPTDAGSSVAADVGGKLLFLWNSGAIGGLRMRLAAPDKMKETEDVVITDTREEKAGSAVSSIASMRVLATNTYALVFFNTTSGVKVLRVEPATGKLTPVQGTL